MGQKEVSLLVRCPHFEMHARVVYTWGGKMCPVYGCPYTVEGFHCRTLGLMYVWLCRYFQYGALGVVIGHELTHGFDDEGTNIKNPGIFISPCYSCTMAARGLRGMREWRRYIDHEGGARVDL